MEGCEYTGKEEEMMGGVWTCVLQDRMGVKGRVSGLV